MKEDQLVNSISRVNKSGNSDVDVTVNIDTSALAYAYACMMYAEGKLNKNQFEKMVNEMDKLYQREEYKERFGEKHHKKEQPRRQIPWLFT
ncbi:hypothetical protein [Alteribacillus bidgolensis]|uniref:Uncharacterized protein n=1 Tax=Alteribacillus bidgolensis TaxID=930129 RepID=A0A1G8Q013_9BACI|nr:hypothetical protein [Alteribacillus bidgolensis]SDI98109.1 hypothetical protein SAMN05216352_11719 [Alteribacillus bidgolensis]